jgi:hypothetical protein
VRQVYSSGRQCATPDFFENGLHKMIKAELQDGYWADA